jgi:spore germination protein YaaH
MDLLEHNATRPRVYNDSLQSPFFNIVSGGQTKQIYYDDPLSLQVKYDAARAAGWRGAGMWNADVVVYGSPDPVVQAQTSAMWASLATVRQW